MALEVGEDDWGLAQVPDEGAQEAETDKQSKNLKTNKKSKKIRKIKYPCAVCDTGVGENSVKCEGCRRWCHLKCSGLASLFDYNRKIYRCSKCKENKKGSGKPSKGSLTVDNKSANNVRKFSKGKRRQRDDESPVKITKPKVSTDPDRSPLNKKSKAGDAQQSEGEDDDEDEKVDQEEEEKDLDEEDEEEDDEEDEEED